MIAARMTLFSAAKVEALLRRSADLGPAVGRVIRGGAIQMRNQIIARVPVRTGNLRDSIEVKAEFPPGGFRIRSYTNLIYGPAQEFNAMYNHHHPEQKNPNAQFGFMRKALVEVGQQMRTKLDRIMRRGGE